MINTEAFLEGLALKAGSHASPEDGMCAMEAVAFLAGEKHSDAPACACQVIASFMRSWNDALSDSDRQKLKRYLPKLLNTKSTFEVEQKRGLMAADWFIRVYTPTWLALGNLQEFAYKLRATPEIVSWDDVTKAETLLSAAGSAAESAAWSAAKSAAWSAAWSAARSAAWSAAKSAAWSAAWSVAESAAWSAAKSAAWSAAGSVDNAVLSGAVEHLQASAFELLEKMIAVSAPKAATV